MMAEVGMPHNQVLSSLPTRANNARVEPGGRRKPAEVQSMPVNKPRSRSLVLSSLFSLPFRKISLTHHLAGIAALGTCRFVEGELVRRILIQSFLPICFSMVPLLVAIVIALAMPPAALAFYLKSIRTSYIDWLILGLGGFLFVIQILLAWRALQWRGTRFNERHDDWLTHLAQAAEWFPLLGLIGTVAGILQTFSQITGQVAPEEIIRLYAPAITATGSGLFMALINILPTWVVLIGRELIMGLAGGERTPPEESTP